MKKSAMAHLIQHYMQSSTMYKRITKKQMEQALFILQGMNINELK